VTICLVLAALFRRGVASKSLTARGPSIKEHHTWIDVGVIGDDSDQMVDHFEVDVIDRHPELVVMLAGLNDRARP
jgi:hypothetical protein